MLHRKYFAWYLELLVAFFFSRRGWNLFKQTLDPRRPDDRLNYQPTRPAVLSSAAVNAWPRPVLTERWPDRVTGYKARRFTWTRRLFILLLNVDELVGQESRLTRSRWSQAANTVSKRTRSVYRQTRHITGDFRDEFSRQSIVLAMTAATLTKTPRNNCLTIST